MSAFAQLILVCVHPAQNKQETTKNDQNEERQPTAAKTKANKKQQNGARRPHRVSGLSKKWPMVPFSH